MDPWAEIRRRVSTGDIRNRDACRLYDLHRPTLRKNRTRGEPPGYRRVARPRRPTIGPVRPVVRRIPDGDTKAPRKPRHTVRRIALDRLQPDIGREVLWVIRDCLSGQVVVAKSLLSATGADLAGLWPGYWPGPPRWRSAGRRGGVGRPALDPQRRRRGPPGVPHQLCQFHYLREADRHANKDLKKHARGVREIERQVEDRGGPKAEVVRG